MTYRYESIPKGPEIPEEKVCNKCQKLFIRKHKGNHTCPKCAKVNESIRTPRCEDQGAGFTSSVKYFEAD